MPIAVRWNVYDLLPAYFNLMHALWISIFQRDEAHECYLNCEL